MLSVSSERGREHGDATFTREGERLCFSMQHSMGRPFWLCSTKTDACLHLSRKLAEGGLTMAFVFDPPAACAGNLKQRLDIQCGTTNGSTSPGTTAANICSAGYGVSSEISAGTTSWKRWQDEETL